MLNYDTILSWECQVEWLLSNSWKICIHAVYRVLQSSVSICYFPWQDERNVSVLRDRRICSTITGCSHYYVSSRELSPVLWFDFLRSVQSSQTCWIWLICMFSVGFCGLDVYPDTLDCEHFARQDAQLSCGEGDKVYILLHHWKTIRKHF